MKRLLFALFIGIILASCATTTYDSEGRQLTKADVKRVTANVIKQRLEQRRYRIFVDYMYPSRMPSVHLTDDWGVEVSRDSIGLFLPYFGRVYMAPIGKGPGMLFISPLQNYNERVVKDGHHQIVADFRHDTDSYQVIMDIYNNGAADICVINSNRESIRYSGKVDMDGVFFYSQEAAAKRKLQ